LARSPRTVAMLADPARPTRIGPVHSATDGS
jgi:hypothetical protein